MRQQMVRLAENPGVNTVFIFVFLHEVGRNLECDTESLAASMSYRKQH
jgi:hypothetical protein